MSRTCSLWLLGLALAAAATVWSVPPVFCAPPETLWVQLAEAEARRMVGDTESAFMDCAEAVQTGRRLLRSEPLGPDHARRDALMVIAEAWRDEFGSVRRMRAGITRSPDDALSEMVLGLCRAVQAAGDGDELMASLRFDSVRRAARMYLEHDPENDRAESMRYLVRRCADRVDNVRKPLVPALMPPPVAGRVAEWRDRLRSLDVLRPGVVPSGPVRPSRLLATPPAMRASARTARIPRPYLALDVPVAEEAVAPVAQIGSGPGPVRRDRFAAGINTELERVEVSELGARPGVGPSLEASVSQESVPGPGFEAPDVERLGHASTEAVELGGINARDGEVSSVGTTSAVASGSVADIQQAEVRGLSSGEADAVDLTRTPDIAAGTRRAEPRVDVTTFGAAIDEVMVVPERQQVDAQDHSREIEAGIAGKLTDIGRDLSEGSADTSGRIDFGALMERRGDPDAAMEGYLLAVRLMPETHTDAAYEAALELCNEKDAAEGFEKVVLRQIEAREDIGLLGLLRYDILRCTGRDGDALEWMLRMAKRSDEYFPEVRRADRGLGDAFDLALERDELDRAAELARVAGDREPGRMPEMHLALARARIEAEEPQAASALLEGIVEARPTGVVLAQARNLLQGVRRAQEGEIPLEFVLLEDQARIQPGRYDDLGELYEKKGMLEDALRAYRQHNQQFDTAYGHARVVGILFAMGRTGEAVDGLVRQSARYPDEGATASLFDATRTRLQESGELTDWGRICARVAAADEQASETFQHELARLVLCAEFGASGLVRSDVETMCEPFRSSRAVRRALAAAQKEAGRVRRELTVIDTGPVGTSGPVEVARLCPEIDRLESAGTDIAMAEVAFELSGGRPFPSHLRLRVPSVPGLRRVPEDIGNTWRVRLPSLTMTPHYMAAGGRAEGRGRHEVARTLYQTVRRAEKNPYLLHDAFERLEELP